jgi:hypothetical protein
MNPPTPRQFIEQAVALAIDTAAEVLPDDLLVEVHTRGGLVLLTLGVPRETTQRLMREAAGK